MDLTFKEGKYILAKKHIDAKDETFSFPPGKYDAKEQKFLRIC